MLVNVLSKVGCSYKPIHNGILSWVFSWKHSKIFQKIFFVLLRGYFYFFLFFFFRGSEWLPSLEKIVQRRSVKKSLLNKKLWHSCFPLNFAKFLRTPIFIEHLQWLLVSSDITLDVCS